MDFLSSAYRGLALLCFSHFCGRRTRLMARSRAVEKWVRSISQRFFALGIRRIWSGALWHPSGLWVIVNFVDSERWHTWALRTGVSDTARWPVLVGARPLEDELRAQTSKTIIDRRGWVEALLSR